MQLIVLFFVALALLGLVSATFQSHPKERFPEQWDKYDKDGVPQEDRTAPPDDF